jgi:hypothetical protein
VQPVQELVADKGYHSNDALRDMGELEIRTYVSLFMMPNAVSLDVTGGY